MPESDAIKGPWVVTPWSSSFIQTPLTISAPGFEICEVTDVDRDPDGDFYTGLQTRANANLMAAAPELLEALESCAGWLEWMDDPRCGLGDNHKKVIKQARAAITKAKSPTGNI